jgi:hypothetical protein
VVSFLINGIPLVLYYSLCPVPQDIFYIHH